MHSEELLLFLFALVVCSVFVGGIFLTAHWMGPPDSEKKSP